MQGKIFKCSTADVRQLDVEQSLTGIGGVLGTSCGFLRVLRGLGDPQEALGESLGGSWGIHGRAWRVLGGSWRTLWGVLGGSWGLLVRTWGVPGETWRMLQGVLERSRGDPRQFFSSLGAAEYAYLWGICEVFGIRQAGLLFCVFFVLLPSECCRKHFESLFGPKACLAMVRGGV